ncbi:MAG: cytidine deaminase [Alphaproteobacteria bacterium]|nr:MAG: cytidine deaminase [Alphaproteobacteria bacterium]
MTEISADLIEKMKIAAMTAQKNAYCPYSDHPVGTAVLDEQGRIFGGCNVETAHFKGVCAEASAISAMVTAGGKKLQAVFITAPDENLCGPCGDCRQRLYEFSTPDMPIYAATKSGQVKKILTLEELLPYAFGPQNIPPRG